MANPKKQPVQKPISNRTKIIAAFFGLILGIIIIYFISQSGHNNSQNFGNSDATPEISVQDNTPIDDPTPDYTETRTVTSATCKIEGVNIDQLGTHTTLITLEASGTASGPITEGFSYVLEHEWLQVSSSNMIEEGLEYDCGSWSKDIYPSVFRCIRKEGQPKMTTWSAKWTHYGLTDKDPVLEYGTDTEYQSLTVPCN